MGDPPLFTKNAPVFRSLASLPVERVRSLSWLYMHGYRTLKTQETGKTPTVRDHEVGDLETSLAPVDHLPSMLCVSSNDSVWAELLAHNLSARGLNTVQCSLSYLKHQIAALDDDSWVIIDGGWPMSELQNSADDLNQVLSRARISTVIVVDELVGPHLLAALEPDAVIKRAPDMRILVRNLLSLFQSPSHGRVLPA